MIVQLHENITSVIAFQLVNVVYWIALKRPKIILLSSDCSKEKIEQLIRLRKT